MPPWHKKLPTLCYLTVVETGISAQYLEVFFAFFLGHFISHYHKKNVAHLGMQLSHPEFVIKGKLKTEQSKTGI